MSKHINGNSIEILKTLKDESIDFIVTDPPYEITKRGYSALKGVMSTKKSLKGNFFDYDIPHIDEYIKELYRVLKPNTLCCIMVNNLNLYKFLKSIKTKTKFKFIKLLIWEKSIKVVTRYLMSNYEIIILLRKGKDRPANDNSKSDIIKIPHQKLKYKGELINPTGKPIKLYEFLIQQFSNKGDTILDPFVGSGSFIIACRNLNRNYIAIEIDKKQYKNSKKVIKEYFNTPTLF